MQVFHFICTQWDIQNIGVWHSSSPHIRVDALSFLGQDPFFLIWKFHSAIYFVQFSITKLCDNDQELLVFGSYFFYHPWNTYFFLSFSLTENFSCSLVKVEGEMIALRWKISSELFAPWFRWIVWGVIKRQYQQKK